MARPKPKASVPQRANKDSPTRWQKGGPSPNPAGRFALPEWFKGLNEVALAMQAAAGLGVVIDEVPGDTPESKKAREMMARDCPPNIRDATSNRIVERLCGPIKQEVKVDDEGMTVSRVLRVIVESEHTKPVVEMTPQIEIKRPS